jgi:hypothetical protein
MHHGHVERPVGPLAEGSHEHHRPNVGGEDVERLDAVGSSVCAPMIEKYLRASSSPESVPDCMLLAGDRASLP